MCFEALVKVTCITMLTFCLLLFLGTSVVLKVPYPNNIYEPKPYEDVTRQTENPSATPASTQEQDFHVSTSVLIYLLGLAESL